MATDGGSGRKRILFLTPQLPYPPEQGTAIRNYNLIAQVAQRHDVALLSFVEPGSAPDPGPLADLCRPLVTVPAPQRTLPARLRTLILTGQPDMALRLWSEPFADALRRLLEEGRYDVVQVEGIELAPYGLALQEWLGERAPRVVFDDHNCEYVLQCRAFETDLRRPRRWPQAAYSLAQWRRLLRYERHVCALADGLACVSEADAAAIRALSPALRPVVVPNGVDVDRYHPSLPDSLPLEHPAIVFTGKMDFRPNIDAIAWFYDQVWPAIRAASAARLYIVGKSPHPSLARLAADPRVTVTGYVADILPYFGGADVYIVPLRIGGGTRLKVLEAMSAGLPLVSTTVGAEGIALQSGRDAVYADDAAAFSQAVLRLLGDPALRAEMGLAARGYVVAHYDWRAIAPLLEPLYDAAKALGGGS
jgi:sugar transferase (PEP-CTERM/EpsH1 system associated)